MSRLHKYGNRDKYDAHMPNERKFMHDDYYVSPYQERVHVTYGYAHYGKGTGHRGFTFGVEKRLGKASRLGIMIDSFGIGLSDQ